MYPTCKIYAEIVPVSSIVLSPLHRETTSAKAEKHIASIARTLPAVGLLTAIVVRANGDDTYTLIDGAHRLKACTMAGYDSVPVVFAEDEAEVESIAYNTSRASTAADIVRLVREGRISPQEIAERTGMSVEYVYTLAGSSPEVVDAYLSGSITLSELRKAERERKQEEREERRAEMARAMGLAVVPDVVEIALPPVVIENIRSVWNRLNMNAVVSWELAEYETLLRPIMEQERALYEAQKKAKEDEKARLKAEKAEARAEALRAVVDGAK